MNYILFCNDRLVESHSRAAPTPSQTQRVQASLLDAFYVPGALYAPDALNIPDVIFRTLL